jgi:hypothetical protein
MQSIQLGIQAQSQAAAPPGNMSGIQMQQDMDTKQGNKTTNLETSSSTGNTKWATIKVVSTCKLNNASCALLLDDLFRVQPSTMRDNYLKPIGEFAPSQFGRTVSIFVPNDPSGNSQPGPVEYDIIQSSNPIARELFDIITQYSYDCHGQINGGESRKCAIDSTLYPH